MKSNIEFFNKLNNEIKGARTKKTLKSLTKTGYKYIEYLPSSTDPKFRKNAKQRLIKSLKLIKLRKKHVK